MSYVFAVLHKFLKKEDELETASTGQKLVHRKVKKNDRNDLTIETIEHERSFAALLQNFSIVPIVFLGFSMHDSFVRY